MNRAVGLLGLGLLLGCPQGSIPPCSSAAECLPGFVCAEGFCVEGRVVVRPDLCGPAGCVVHGPDQTRMVIPEGALSVEVKLSIRRASDTTPTPGLDKLSGMYVVFAESAPTPRLARDATMWIPATATATGAEPKIWHSVTGTASLQALPGTRTATIVSGRVAALGAFVVAVPAAMRPDAGFRPGADVSTVDFGFPDLGFVDARPVFPDARPYDSGEEEWDSGEHGPPDAGMEMFPDFGFQPPDAGSEGDTGGLPDSGMIAAETGVPDSGEVLPDGGASLDAGGIDDLGVSIDAGGVEDQGTPDAGSENDGGAAPDGGNEQPDSAVPDAGSEGDATTPPPDAGAMGDADPPPDSGPDNVDASTDGGGN